MMNKKFLCLAGALSFVPALSHAESPYFSFKDGENFKRFSVSVGALYVKPTGKAQPFHVNTSIANGETAAVGAIGRATVLNNLDPDGDPNFTTKLLNGVDKLNNRLDPYLPPEYRNKLLNELPPGLSGNAQIYGLDQWNNPGTGLEADDVTTLGIMTNYFFTDHISLEVKAGIPPKVDLQGKGKIYAPFSATATPVIDADQILRDYNIKNNIVGTIASWIPDIALPKMDLKNNILITDLEAHGAVASARAWTPAFEFQYHFGKTGVNKFRPYVGVGMMYAYFNELEMNPAIRKDLVDAGHMIANIKQGNAGAALERKKSTANPVVELEASDAFAPIGTVGFTYDFNDRWFAAASVSYAQLKAETTIKVKDAQLGELIEAKSDIEINPILGYAGIGYRF